MTRDTIMSHFTGHSKYKSHRRMTVAFDIMFILQYGQSEFGFEDSVPTDVTGVFVF